MRGQLSLACTFEDEGLSGENITAEKLDLAAAEQSEVLVVSRKIKAFQSFYLQSKLSHKDICTSKGNAENSRMIMVGDVLQKIDCHVEEILATAGHVTLYDFDMELSH